MSRLKRTVDIYPPEAFVVSKVEKMAIDGFCCPNCHGKCGFLREIGRGVNEWLECDHCNGSGELKANVTIEWLPA